ncbi:MAG TPA: hypothetical protein VKU39_03215, partial [Streptosporangiaceae bacterium]|nr:hypothetical protein [Streptosporangiaceae bacterium]
MTMTTTAAVVTPQTRADAVLLNGRFRLDRRVAVAGTTGEVSLWRATDLLLGRPVSVHLLPAWAAIPAGLPESVQAAARVNDVRFTAIYDACYDVDCPNLVTEWPAGQSLRDLLRTGLPSPALAAHIVAEAASAVAGAHEQGRPHLCLDLRSLYWGRSGVKITGLGIDAALTQRETADHGADATALARILYVLLTGRPLTGEDTALPEPRHLSSGV